MDDGWSIHGWRESNPLQGCQPIGEHSQDASHEVIPQGDDHISDQCGSAHVGSSTSPLTAFPIHQPANFPVYLPPSLWLFQPVCVQEFFITQNFFCYAICRDETFIHHDRARKQFLDQPHIMC
jgi:hypothetical protein